jgi:hypothetical protein
MPTDLLRLPADQMDLSAAKVSLPADNHDFPAANHRLPADLLEISADFRCPLAAFQLSVTECQRFSFQLLSISVFSFLEHVRH